MIRPPCGICKEKDSGLIVINDILMCGRCFMKLQKQKKKNMVDYIKKQNELEGK